MRSAHVYRVPGGYVLKIYQAGQVVSSARYATRPAAMFAGVAALFGQVVADA